MDSPSSTSSGLGKLLPKAIATRRRSNNSNGITNKGSPSASEVSSLGDEGGQGGQGRGKGDAGSLNGSLNGSIASIASSDPPVADSDPESTKSNSNSNSNSHDASTSRSRPTAARTPLPVVQVAHDPSPNPTVARSATFARDSTDSLDPAPPLERSRTTLGPPELRSKRSASTSRLRDVFKTKKSVGEKTPAPENKQQQQQQEPQHPPPPPPSKPEPAHEHDHEHEPKPSVDNTTPRRRPLSLQTDTLAPPRTPPSDAATPVIVNTPPTPTDPKPGGAPAGSPRRPADAVLAGNMITQRRRAGSNAGPSKLSTITSAPTPPALTPTPENPNPNKNPPATPGNPAATFFSSMFSAVQNTASSLSTNIPTLAPGANKNKASPAKEQPQPDLGPDAVEVESVGSQRPSTEPKEPAVKTLGMGDLSLSQLGIVDAPSASPSPVAARFAESETRARSDSAPPPPEAHVVDTPEYSHSYRPQSFHEAAGGEHTPPAGSVYEGKAGGVQRSGSMRSALGHRRNRGSSIATHGTTATSTVGAAIAAANSSLVSPGTGTVASAAPKLTGFAVANKKRNRDFHALFKSVPDDDYLIEDYSCALQREILAHGRLYISEGHLCFSSNILGWVTTLVMSFDEIVSVEKRSTALVFKNGLEISTLHAKHIFASFASRDTTYDLIIKIWKLGHPQLQSSLNGVRLEEPGGDRTEKVDVEATSLTGTHSISASDEESDEGDEVYDEDEDEGVAQAAGPPPDGPVPELAEKAAPRKVSGAVAPPEKLEDGAAGGAADFPGPATHAPTDCGDAAGHFERTLGDDVIPAPLGKVYTMLFGPASATWMGRWLTTDQKCTELQMEDKRGLTDEIRTRNYTYIKPLYASIGPKQTKCIVTEQLETIDLEKAVHVLVSTQNPDVPSGNIFAVKTKYCLSWAENNGTRVQISNVIEWTGKSWLKGAIERGANEGQTQYCKDLFSGLKSAVSSRARAATLNGAAARGGAGKKRSRKTKSALLSHPAGDAEGAAKAAAKQGWGLFEPARPLLSPVVDTIRPILTGNVVYGLLVGLLVASWFGFGTRQGGAGGHPRYGHEAAALAWGSTPQRLAAYEELWRREESELWEWIEERAGLERLGAEPPLGRKRSVDPRTVEERVREARMDERELREAIRVTEERLEVLKGVVEGRGR